MPTISGRKDEFEFVGFVESINIKGVGPAASHQFLFSLKNEQGDHNAYRLDWSDPARYQAMVSLLMTAYVAEKRVSLRTAPTADGVPYAGELQIQA